jgi:hypothetical protein
LLNFWNKIPAIPQIVLADLSILLSPPSGEFESIMRELTKSLLTFSLTMSLFGVKQLGNLLNSARGQSPGLQMKEAFDSLSNVAQQQFGETFQETFQAGDEMQRRMVDAMYGFLEPDRDRTTRPPSSPQPLSQQSGWGPVV